MRERCAGRGCRHARSAHDHEGRCWWPGCVGCRGWALRREHWWREHCWDVWYGAWLSWRLAREEECIGYATEQRLYDAEHPQPTFKETLMGLSRG